MYSFFRTLTAVALSGLLATAAFAAPSSAPGHVDFGEYTAGSGDTFVEVDVDGALLKLAALFADREDPEIGKLVANLQRVRVNVFDLTDDNRGAAIERVQALRAKLPSQGWKRIVTVQEREGEDVGVYLKQGEDNAVQGIVVTVLSGSKEAVLVNIVGNVTLEQIATVGQRLDIQPLRDLKVAAR